MSKSPIITKTRKSPQILPEKQILEKKNISAMAITPQRVQHLKIKK